MFDRLKNLFNGAPSVFDPKNNLVDMKKRTFVCFLLDESGSMAHIVRPTISGVNEYIHSLKQDQGDSVYFTLVKFSSDVTEELYRMEPIQRVEGISQRTYRPNGGTPLFDAIGKTIKMMENLTQPGDLVLFTILTDGEENSSNEFRMWDVEQLVHRKKREGWRFTFLGSGIDAYRIGGTIGFATMDCLTVDPNQTKQMYSSMSAATTQLRSAYTSAQDISKTVSLAKDIESKLKH